MKLKLNRTTCGAHGTLGDLYIDNEWFCFTLEDTDRQLETGGEKIMHETCIPRGTYEVVITWSNRFKRELPLLKDVPQFEGIRIHPGNRTSDSSGCILVGSATSTTASHHPMVMNSRATFDQLLARLEAAYAANVPVTLEVA